jgi:hypothetical protein
MALTVIFGLISSTGLTLIIIPLIYHMTDNLKSRLLGTQPGTEPATHAALPES